MASIRKRDSRINVQIRKKGYPLVSKSFVSLTVAKKWAVVTEADMERGLHVIIPDDTTVGNLLDRYIKEILPTHKGRQVERYRLGTLKRCFGPMRVTDLTAKEVAEYRDPRLKEVTGISQKGTCDLAPGINPRQQRLGHCPSPEPCKDDYLA